jgi:hypothetical protein
MTLKSHTALVGILAAGFLALALPHGAAEAGCGGQHKANSCSHGGKGGKGGHESRAPRTPRTAIHQPRVDVTVPRPSVNVSHGGYKGGHKSHKGGKGGCGGKKSCGGCGDCGGGGKTTIIKKEETTKSSKFVFNFGRRGGDTYIGGGSSFHYYIDRSPDYIERMHVEYEYEREREREYVRGYMAIRAVCVDDRGGSHPAARLDPSRTVDPSYRGELYRCVIGTRLMVMLSSTFESTEHFSGDFTGAQTIHCAKNEALWHGKDGQLYCAPRTPQRDCYERSLLRTHGPGDKIIFARFEREYEYEREYERESIALSGMTLSGGVGGFPY